MVNVPPHPFFGCEKSLKEPLENLRIEKNREKVVDFEYSISHNKVYRGE